MGGSKTFTTHKYNTENDGAPQKFDKEHMQKCLMLLSATELECSVAFQLEQSELICLFK